MSAAAPKRSRRPEPVRPASSRPPVTTARPELTGDGTGERFRQLVSDLLTIAARMDAVRARFADPAALDFAWRGAPPRRAAASAVPLDLCGSPRPAPPAPHGAAQEAGHA